MVSYAPDMAPDVARRWNSWEDFMRQWCRRENFRSRLPELLRGEDHRRSRVISGGLRRKKVAASGFQDSRLRRSRQTIARKLRFGSTDRTALMCRDSFRLLRTYLAIKSCILKKGPNMDE